MEEKATELSSSSEGNSSKIEEALRQATQSLEEAIALKNDTIKLDAELKGQIAETRAAAVSADDISKQAIESVKKALRDVRAQGLAGAFQSRSDKLLVERRLWILAFIGSAAVLGLLAIIFVAELTTVTYESLTIHLLRKICTTPGAA